MVVAGPARQETLRLELMRVAADQAEYILVHPSQEIKLRTLHDDGLSGIERLELSPFPEDQFLAVAVRLSSRGRLKGQIFHALQEHFRLAPITIAVEAQRKLIWNGCGNVQLPYEAALEAVEALEAKTEASGQSAGRLLLDYADLYSDLWCDPRISAAPYARRLMVEMVSVLHERAEVVEQAPATEKIASKT